MPYITSFERFGIKKGLKQGLQEGIAGALAAKFGKADKRIMAKVRSTESVEVLRALLAAIPVCDTIEEIRQRLAERLG